MFNNDPNLHKAIRYLWESESIQEAQILDSQIEWSDNETRRAWEIVNKYKDDLVFSGINVSSILQPPKARIRGNKRIEIINDQFWVEFLFDHIIVAILRTIPEELIRYQKEPKKGNWIQFDPRVENQLKTLIERYDFSASDETIEKIKNLKFEEKKTFVREITRFVDPSGKEFVDFYSPTKNLALVDQIKLISGRDWLEKELRWRVPLTRTSAEKIHKIAVEWNFKVAEEVSLRLQRLMEQAREKREAIDKEKAEREARETELFLLSRADDCEIELPSFGSMIPGNYQKVTPKYLELTKRIILGDSPGCGKTLQALMCAELYNAYPIIVVTPSVEIGEVWQEEARKALPHRLSRLLLSGKTTSYTGRIVIVSYKLLAAHIDALRALKPGMVVFDEFHYCKTPTSERGRLSFNLAQKVKYRMGLTGTPIRNRTGELIHQLDILGQLDEFGGKKVFRRTYGPRGGKNARLDLEQKLRSVCMVRRLKSQVLDQLPPYTITVIKVDIDNRAEYERVENDLISWVTEQALKDKEFIQSIADLSEEDQKEAKQKHAADAGRKAMRAEVLVRINACRKVIAQGKLNSIIQWSEDFLENEEKLGIFAHHREIQTALIQKFPKFAQIISETKDVTAQKKRFQEKDFEDCPGIILSMGRSELGHTLTAGSYAVFAELGWVPAAMDQCISRFHRKGQKSAVNGYWFVGKNTYDEVMLDLLAEKERIADQALDGSGDVIRNESIMSEFIARITGVKEAAEIEYND